MFRINSVLHETVCSYCKKTFQAKRVQAGKTTAQYCSPLCQSRARPKRPKPTPDYYAFRRKERLKILGYREYCNAQANERAKKIRAYLDNIKITKGCIDCGYNKHPAALDFDHVFGEKEHLVSFSKSIKQANKEMEKCEIRCSNCHRIRTWERRRAKKENQ